MLHAGPAVARTVDLGRVLVGVHGHVDPAIADGVQEDLEAQLVVECHRAVQLLGREVGQARAPAGIGLEHGRGLRFDHAVHEALDGPEAEPGRLVALSEFPVAGEHVGSGVLDHGQGGVHPHLQTVFGEHPVEHLEIGLVEGRVVDGGETVGGGEVEALLQEPVLRLLVDGRHLFAHETLRRFLEDARGLTLLVLHDHAVRRVRAELRDSGLVEGHGVGPPGVAVVARHPHRPVRDDRVEVLLVGHPSGERAVEPPAAHHPGGVGVGLRIGGDALLDLLHAPGVVEVDHAQGEAAAHEMKMPVGEARVDEAALQIDDVRRLFLELLDLAGGAHGQQRLFPDRERFGQRLRAVPRPDVPIDEDAVGLLGGRGRGGERERGRRQDGEADQGSAPHDATPLTVARADSSTPRPSRSSSSEITRGMRVRSTLP